jgi:hypothetical protein
MGNHIRERVGKRKTPRRGIFLTVDAGREARRRSCHAERM